MKKFFKIWLILFGVGVLSAIGTYIYIFHKPHRNIAKEKPAYVLNAQDLYIEFSSNENTSYEKYGNKVLQISGEVVEISVSNNSASITILDEMEGINCAFDSITMVKNHNQLIQIEEGDRIEIKGQCDGYDMIMGVVLSRCVLL